MRHLKNWNWSLVSGLVITLMMHLPRFVGASLKTIYDIFLDFSDISMTTSIALATVILTLFSITAALTSSDLWKERKVSESGPWKAFCSNTFISVCIAIACFVFGILTKIMISIPVHYKLRFLCAYMQAFLLGVVIFRTIKTTSLIVNLYKNTK